MQLLKSEDDESGKGSSMGRPGDVMRIKDEPHVSHSGNPNNLSPEELRRMLKHQGDPAMTRKRSLNDPDDGLTVKRNDPDRPSKLRESNKMLASLLSNPPKNIPMNINPGIKTIPDKVPGAMGRVTSSLGGGSSSGGNTLGSLPGKSPTAIAGRGRGHKQSQMQQQQQQQQPSDVYLSAQQQQQQQQNMDPTKAMGSNLQQQRPNQPLQQIGSVGQMGFSSSTGEHPFATPPLNTTASSTTATSTSSSNSGGVSVLGLGDGDTELSKILDSVMEYVTDDQQFAPTTPTGLTQQQINERMAIKEIQNSLMVETSVYRTSGVSGPSGMMTQQMLQQQMQQHQQQHSQLQPPAYPGSMMSAGNLGSAGNMTAQQQQMMMQMHMMERMRQNQSFQRPPPNYPARGRAPMNAVATPGGGVMPASVVQRYRSQQMVQQQKERLLQQQQKQHMLVPENATARNDQLCKYM